MKTDSILKDQREADKKAASKKREAKCEINRLLDQHNALHEEVKTMASEIIEEGWWYVLMVKKVSKMKELNERIEFLICEEE